jgi:hypothetical protein
MKFRSMTNEDAIMVSTTTHFTEYTREDTELILSVIDSGNSSLNSILQGFSRNPCNDIDIPY